MNKKKYLIIIILCLFNIPIVLSHSYPAKSFKISEDGKTLIKWLGNETEINMQEDPILSQVTHLGDEAFRYNDLLEKIIIGDKVVSIGNYTFNGCPAIIYMMIPPNVKTIGIYAFSHCPNLVSISVDDNNSHFCSFDNVLFNKDKTILIKYPAAKKTDLYIIPSSVKKIQREAFSRCWYNMQAILISENVSEIYQYEFGDCWTMDRIYVDPKNEKFYSYEGSLYDKNTKGLLQFPYGKKDGAFMCEHP